MERPCRTRISVGMRPRVGVRHGAGGRGAFPAGRRENAHRDRRLRHLPGRTPDGGARRLLRRPRRGRAHAGDAFVWIGLHEPTEKEFDLVTEEFGLHPLAVEDALNAHQRPKLEVYDDSLFVVLKPVGVRAGDRHRLLRRAHGLHRRLLRGDRAARRGARRSRPYGTGWRRSPRCCATARRRCCTRSATPSSTTTWRWRTSCSTDLEELEAEVFSPSGRRARAHTASRIYTFKRQILEFRRATGPLAAPMQQALGHGPLRPGVPFVHEEAEPFFRDVSDHLTRVERVGGGPGPAGLRRAVGAPRADERPAERRHAEDLRVGRHGRGPDDGRGHLRHELRPHAGAALGVVVPGGDRADGRAWRSCCTGMFKRRGWL